jgi:hypothetical protein
MEKIKSYEEFCNEEINWKKFLSGAALASSLILSPIKSDAITIQQYDKTELLQLHNSQTLFTKRITIIGTQDEVLTKLVKNLRQEGGYVNLINKQKLTATFTLTDIKPDNSKGFTNIGLEIIISGNTVEIQFKKIDFFYSGAQPKSRTQQLGNNLKSTGIDVLTGMTRNVIRNPVIGNRIGSELQKNKSQLYQQPQNFTYQEAINSNKNHHKTFMTSLNQKIDSLIQSINFN